MNRATVCLALVSAAFPATGYGEEDFGVKEISVADSKVQLRYPAEEGYYYILYRGEHVETIAEAIDLTMAPEGRLSDEETDQQRQAYYRVEKISVDSSFDTDQDGIDDVAELKHPTILDPLEKRDADLDFDNDGKTNKEELNAPGSATDPGDAVFETIEFKTADDFTIAASLGIPETLSEPLPVVIFVHQGGSTRREWESVAKRVFRQGMATLAYDIRGHGQSSGRWTNAWYDDPDNAPEDLKAAIEYAKNLARVADNRVAVVGSSVGGNLACVASARYGIKTAVAISHKTSAVFNLAGVDSLAFRSIYHISSQGDQGGQRARWATELFEQTAEPHKLEITRGSDHGVAVFRTAPTVPDRILQWLQDTL